MIVYGYNGVMEFNINMDEKSKISPSFFKNKKFVKFCPDGEKWVFNNTDLWDKGFFAKNIATIGGAIPKNDYYSNKKEEVFTYLNLIERDEGVFATDLSPFKRIIALNDNGESDALNGISGSGFVFAGDLVNGVKIRNFKYYYDIVNNYYTGWFG